MIGKKFGVYKVLEKRGEGGMGVFYKAHDEVLDEIVGLKTLHHELVSDPKFIKDLEAEARLQARLRDHTNIVRLNHYMIQEGYHFLVMEYVEGQTLSEKIGDWGPYNFAEAAEIALQVLNALNYAHENGVVHRDIKPSNIMITEDGVVKVTDFGIAKHLDATQKTRTTHVKGSVFYMPPEQIQHGDIDGRTDFYALGVTLFEMVTGTVPFTAESEFSIMKKHIDESPPKASAFNSEITRVQDELILHAMEKDPADRFQTTAEFGAALRDTASMTGSDILAPITEKKTPAEETGKGEPPPKRPIWHKLVYAVVSIVCILAIVQFVFNIDIIGLSENGGKQEDDNGKIMLTAHPPQWVVIGNATVEVNEALTLTIEANDADNDLLTLEVIGEVPPASRLVDHGNNTGTFTMTPSEQDVGRYPVRFLASDRKYSDTMELWVTVTRPEPPDPTTALRIGVEPFNQQDNVRGVWVDGRRVAGGVPFSVRGLSEGRHWVRIETPHGFLTDTVTWAGIDRTISFFISDIKGLLTITASFPDEAYQGDIWVDDRDIDRGTPRKLTLLAGPHKIEVKKDGFRAAGGPKIVRVEPQVEVNAGFRMRPR